MEWFLIKENYDGLISKIEGLLKAYASQIMLSVIYGSVARKEAVAMSDVDLLIVGNKKIKRHLKNALAEFTAQEGIFFDLLFLTLEEYGVWKNHPLLQNALSEGIILLNKLES